MTRRVGTMAYATQSGLGVLAKSFFDHDIVDNILILRHPYYQSHPEWYPANRRYTTQDLQKFLDNIDVLLMFENVWNWQLALAARRTGKRLVMMPMYEYTPRPLPVPAHLYICPSLLDLDYYQEQNAVFMPVPVEQPWRLRQRARHFIHNAGHGGKDYRNGTPELLSAMPFVKSPIRLTVRGQPNEPRIRKLFEEFPGDDRVELIAADVPYEQLWAEGDVFVFPEKFNGLSLPLQEAFASGMLVMAGDRFPMNTWLPKEPLIPVSGATRKKIAVEFNCAEYSPQAIAETIDSWYDRDITEFSEAGQAWAETHSWAALGPEYRKLLNEC